MFEKAILGFSKNIVPNLEITTLNLLCSNLKVSRSLFFIIIFLDCLYFLLSKLSNGNEISIATTFPVEPTLSEHILVVNPDPQPTSKTLSDLLIFTLLNNIFVMLLNFKFKLISNSIHFETLLSFQYLNCSVGLYIFFFF